MALAITYTCPRCAEPFSVVSSVGHQSTNPGGCRACRKLAEIDERWDGIDEMIAFYEGPEVLERVEIFRVASNRRSPLLIETSHD